MSDQAAPPGEFIPAIVLLNQGVPIDVLDLDHETKQPVYDGETARTKKLHVRFTNRAVAELESAFDGLRASVPIVEVEPVVDEHGAALAGPAGPVVKTKTVGHEERVFYGLEAFQKKMEVYPSSATIKALSVALGMPEEDVDRIMLPGRMPEYSNAVGVAWGIAQGVDPTDAAKMLAQGNAGLAAVRVRMASELEKTMVEGLAEMGVSLGPTGSPDGSG